MDDFDPDQYIASFDPDQYLSSQSDSAPAPQSAAPDAGFDPDQYIASFDPDKYLAGQQEKPEAEGHIAGDLREAAHGVIPMATGVLGAGLAGAAAGSIVPGIGNVAGGLVGLGIGAAGMLAGSYVGGKVDDIVSNVLGVDDAPQRQANREARPIETQLAGMAPFIGSPAATLGQRGAGAAMMGAFSGGQQLYEGKFDPTALATDVAFGAAMPNGNRFTKALHEVGESAGKKLGSYIPGRPDITAPNAPADKADAAASATPNTVAGSATAQPPAADPKGAIGYENSKAEGPKDATKKKSTIDEVFGDTGKKGFSQGDKTSDPTIQAAMGGGKATLAPETPAPANVGQVINTGLVEAAQPAQQAAPPVHPDVQAAMTRNAEILKQYNGKRQPTEIKQEFERNRQTIFAPRGPKIVGSPEGTGEVPLAPKVTNTRPERPQATLGPEQAAMAAKHGENSYLAKPAEPVPTVGTPSPAPRAEPPAAEEEYTPEMQAARLAKIQERNNRPQATLAPAEGAPNVEPAPAPRAEAKPAATLAPAEGEAAPIVAKPQKGLPNQRLAREDDAMLTKLREMGWNETADRLEKAPEADRPALRKKIAEALPRDRAKEKSDLENKLGKETNSPEVRDRHNSAIDAIQKSFDEHAPPENETAKELVDRLKGAVDTAHTAHGDNPLHAQKGYRPQKLPNTFQWFRKVQDAAVKRPEYWTQDKIDAFKADENATREASAEYPTQDPKLLDSSIEKSKRGGNVAEAVMEAKGEQSHESAIVEKTSLERATRAIQELGRYMEGTAEYNELSDKAKKTLDAMPPDVRKAWRDSGEKGADPALKGKVKSWLEDHFSDKPQPFATIDTHEQETGYGRQRERQITSRAELADVEKPATDLIKGVVEKPKAKEKKPKYDFEGKKVSPKELSSEEAARILKASEEAQARNKSAAAPKPSYDKVEGDKYSPLNVGIKDMLGRIVDTAKDLGDNQKGGLNLDKVGAEFKKLFDKFARSEPPKTGKLDDNWDIKIQPSPFAKRIRTEMQAAGRNIGEMLNRAGKVDNVIKVHALAAKEQAHILASTKEEQRQMYDALEKRNPDLITDPKLRDIFEHSIIPAHIETAALREWIKANHPETDIGRDTEDGVHRRALNGRNSELELESIGENADPTAGSSPISTTKRSPVMERQFAALEDADGNRHIVHLKIGENGKPTGEFSVWKGHENREMENAPPMEFKNVNDLYKIGDRTFKMKDATTDEIHANVLGADGKPMEYQRDAAASVFTANAYFRQLANHLQTLDRIKSSTEFKKYATDKADLKKEGWKQSEVPGFQKYWMDDHIRESLEDAYQQGFSDSALNNARNFSRAITQSIFWAPTAHIMNVGVHWGVGRGFKWLPTTDNYRGLAETGAQAIKSVITHDKIQDVLHENGAGLIFGGTRAENATRRLAQGLGEIIEKNPGKWEKIADKMGLPVGDLIRGVYKASRTAMWSVNDMFLTQAILEHLRGTGKTLDTASRDEIHEAIAHIERHIPNYRTPSRIISEGENGRSLAKLMRDPLAFGFGRYRYGVFNSFANMTNSVLHGSKAERIETAGQMMVMGFAALVLYPLVASPIARLITGNDATEVRGRGPVAPIGHIKDDLFGRGDLWPLIRETVSMSPLVNSFVDLAIKGKDFGGRDIMNKKDVHDALRGSPTGALKAGTQLTGWAAGQRYSPLSTLNSSLGNPNQGVLGGLRDAVLDWKTPSDNGQKYEAQTPRRLQKETVQRNKTKPNLGDKFLGLFN